MHPEVTANLPFACPKCGMPLVKRPDPAALEYDMRVDATSAAADQLRLTFTFSKADGSSADTFVLMHERELHVFVIRSDMGFFDHVHPTHTGSGRYVLETEWPGAGEYVIFADFVPADAPPQLLQQRVFLRGRTQAPPAHTSQQPRPTVQTVGGLRIALEAEEVRPGTPALLTFTFADASTGEPVRDLQPYLGASGHLFFTDPDFQMASHSHPLEDQITARVRFLVRFMASTTFRIWLQVQRNGEVVTSEWAVSVPDR